MADSDTSTEFPRDELTALLRDGMAALAPPLEDAPAVAARLLDYLALLHRWNRAYNLTAVRDPRQMVVRHLLDSLAALPYVQGPRVLDVGTGAGLPGMVLALARPADWQVTLLDPLAKRMRFLREVQLRLQPENVVLVRGRVEGYRPPAPFDTVICRAFAALPRIVDVGAPLLAPGGRLLALKGGHPGDELAALPADWAGRARVIELAVPHLDAQRHLACLTAPGDGPDGRAGGG